MVEEMISAKFLCKVVSNITEDATACTTCYTNLQQHSTFVDDCLNLEEKIMVYRLIAGINAEDQIELVNVLNFVSKGTLQDTSVDYSLQEVEAEEKYFVQLNNCYPEIEVKDEKLIEMGQQELAINSEETKKDSERCEVNVVYMKLEAKHTLPHVWKCTECAFQSKYSGNLNRHMMIHKSAAAEAVYQCNLCTYQGSHMRCLERHMASRHKSAFRKSKFQQQYQIYNLQDTSKNTANSDLSILKTQHEKSTTKGVSVEKEVKLYKCDFCLFHTLYKDGFKEHMLNHKSTSEVTMYGCELCVYQTKHKGYLKKHMVSHKSISEVKTYACEVCTYQTKYKSTLQKHMVRHNRASDIRTYTCETCNYQTKSKSTLKEHVHRHKTTYKRTYNTTYNRTPNSTMTMNNCEYNCDLCQYQTKDHSLLEAHFLTHKKAIEVIPYRCKYCDSSFGYEKDYLKHMQTHTLG